MGLEIFRDEVMNNDRVRKRSVDGLLKMIEQEREGAQIDRLLIKSLLRMMTSLRVYTEVNFQFCAILIIIENLMSID
ncbi:unnamed protein product [Onchocerca flexuosa]|uniref:Cullin domain-containing protein n=1 Tax=Onchocerca flexuosa TaxID=387005 RepID=A0A183HUA4_9BILA|nr:unnamed protein product [Onchocerca flexuosa]